jgi:aspartate racemase
MGPLATVDFLRKLIEETPAAGDEEHIPLIATSIPQIPSRPLAIVAGGASPLPAMLACLRTLKAAGADAVAIPCNTAHHWYDELTREGGLPVIHIADAACDAVAARGLAGGTVGLIATRGTVAAGFYQRRFAARGLALECSTPEEQQRWVLPAVAAVKRNALAEAHALAVPACEALRARGARAIVLACTETPLAIEHAPCAVAASCIDATRALARACVAWWQRARAAVEA